MLEGFLFFVAYFAFFLAICCSIAVFAGDVAGLVVAVIFYAIGFGSMELASGPSKEARTLFNQPYVIHAEGFYLPTKGVYIYEDGSVLKRDNRLIRVDYPKTVDSRRVYEHYADRTAKVSPTDI